MKKLLILLSILFFLSACDKCALSQIPPQYIFIGENCQATLPSYLDRIHASDNCVLASLVQTPIAGTILAPPQMITRVTVKATDTGGNSSSVSFDVMLVDTIPPVITVDDTLMTSDAMDMIRTLYDQADRIILSKVEEFDAKFPYSELGLPLPDSTTLATENMIMIRTPLKQTGEVERVFQFWSPADTVRFRK